MLTLLRVQQRVRESTDGLAGKGVWQDTGGYRTQGVGVQDNCGGIRSCVVLLCWAAYVCAAILTAASFGFEVLCCGRKALCAYYNEAHT